MANKRLSELNELQAVDLQPDDLTLTTDVSVLESKKLRFQTLKNWILSDPGSITASKALLSDSSSYLIYSGIPNGTASYALTASYCSTSSWANFCNLTIFSSTSSFISGAAVFGKVTSSIFADSSSYLIYSGIPNGTASYALTASLVYYTNTASYLNYTPGTSNGTASYALSSSYVPFSGTASYLNYNGTPNGTSSYSLITNDGTSSYLKYAGTPNGTSSYSISSSYSRTSSVSVSSSFLKYSGTPNGTSSYSVYSVYSELAGSTTFANASTSASWASSSISSSYSLTSSRTVGTSSYSLTSSLTIGTSSHALLSDYVNDSNVYRIWGPYNSKDSGGSNTTTEQYIQNFIITPPTTAGTTIILMAVCDVKTPITTTDTDAASVELYLDYTEPGNTFTYGPLDTSKPNNYISITVTGSVSLSGYNRHSTTLTHDWPNISGSWWRLSVRSSGGALLDTTRGTTFLLYTKPNTSVTQTSYPPF